MNNPSTIGPDELLTIRFPDLKENQVIISGTTKLTFNVSLASTDVNRTLAGNLGRSIIRKLVVKLEGNEIISIDDYDVLHSYYDCWKRTTERLNAVFQGIVEADGQTENAIKYRINTSEKQTMQKIKQWHQFTIIVFAFHWILKSLNLAFLSISIVWVAI